MKRYITHITLGFILALASFMRLYHMPDRPFCGDIWLWTIGINLHKTSFFNLHAHVTENFFKSLTYAPYGWSDTLPFYIASGIYNVLKIPLNEFWIYFVHAFLGILSIFLLYKLGKELFNPSIGIISSAILAILPISSVLFGSSLLYHHDFLIFLQLLLFLSLLSFWKRRSFYSSVLFSFMLFLNAGTENLLILPVVVLFQYLLVYEKEREFLPALKSFLKLILNIRYLLIWLPPFSVLLLHLYIYYRIGKSNLGMLGYVLLRYGGGSSSLAEFMSKIPNQIKMIYEQFFNIYLVIIAVFCLVYFINRRQKLNTRFIGLVFWFLFIFLINVYFGQGQYITTFRYSHYFMPLVLISAYLAKYAFEYAHALKVSSAPKKYLRFFIILFFVALFSYNTGVVLKAVLSREIYSNPLKAASFYVREHGNEETTVFQLVHSKSTYNTRGEYYFGKCFMEPGDETGVKRQLFSFGAHSIDEYKKAYNLEDFDFYILYPGEESDKEAQVKIKDFLSSLKMRGLNKVADIERNGKIVATLYSAHPLAYEKIDTENIDKLWDKKYANLANLFQNRWCGLTALWGFHHRLK